ncbi:MAG: hypothetical protein OEX77_11215 [Candidatus Bathyarchaeota archaeon]|nr:hypothetical protein [Candidatus Bathyarchaeota archaeon]
MTQPSYPPPPPAPKPTRFRPSIVTKLALLHLITGIVLVALGAWALYLGQPWNIATGIICFIAAAVSTVYFLGLYAGKDWVLSLGWRRYLGDRQDVVAYFRFHSPVYPPAYPSHTAPPIAHLPSIPPGQPSASKPSPPPPQPSTLADIPTPRTSVDTPPMAPPCPACKQPLIFGHQHNRWYCQNCERYV